MVERDVQTSMALRSWLSIVTSGATRDGELTIAMSPRTKVTQAIVRSDDTSGSGIPESSNVLVKEMLSLGLKVEITSNVRPEAAAPLEGSDSGEIDGTIARAVELFGGQRILRRRVHSRLDAHDLLKEGLPGHALRHLVESVDMLRTARSTALEEAVGISLRTYQRRKEAPDKRLAAEQSGRAWTFAEILARTTVLLGSQAEAERWLATPAMALDRRRHIDLMSTPAGVQMVEDHLGRLEYGVYT